MLLILIINILIIAIFLAYVDLKIKNVIKNINLFYYSFDQVIKSINKIVIFIIIFIVLIRITKIFLVSQNFIDLNYYVLLLDYLLKNTNYILICIFFNIMLIFKKLKLYYIISVKINFIKLYYFYFYRYPIVRRILLKIAFYDLGLRSYSKLLYYLHLFFRDFMFKFIFIINFLYGFFLNDGYIYIGFLPYYGLYYLITSCILFSKKFNRDFDQGILQCYYSNFFCPLKIGLDKIQLYKVYLFLDSNYYFANSIIYDYSNFKFPEKYIFYKNFDLMFYHSDNIFKICANFEPQFVDLSVYEYCSSIRYNGFKI